MNTQKAGLLVLVSALLGVLGVITTFQSLAAAPCNVSGIISTDTTWNPDQCDFYAVTGNILVLEGTVLTIEPGTVIRFAHLKAMTVQGKLVAVGTASSPIVFSSHLATPAKGDWGYILFTDTSVDNLTCAEDGSGSIVKYTILQYGGGADTNENGVLRAVSSAPCFTYNIIRLNNADGIHIWDGTGPMQITHNIITANGDVSNSLEATGIYYESNFIGTHIITSNKIISNTGDGIVLEVSGTAVVAQNNISSNKTGLNSSVNGTAGVYFNEITENLGRGIYVSSDYVNAKGNVVTQNKDGGIRISSENATIIENTVTYNTAIEGGGGIYLDLREQPIANSTIVDNTIRNNIAQYGGGIAMEGHSNGAKEVALESNDVSYNTAALGGGIFSGSQINTNISNNTISFNSANIENGGGLYIWGDSHSVISNTIINNTANGNGGGTYLRNLVDITLDDNSFMGNYGGQGGGAIAIDGNAVITNNTFEENTTIGFGGALYQMSSNSLAITENTIRNNSAYGYNGKGGGIFLCAGCHPILNSNDICLNDDAYDGDLYNSNGSGTPDVDALDNYWGAAEDSIIERQIWHFLDDSAKGIVDYIPFRTEPVSGDPDVCQPVVSPGCSLKLDLDYNGTQLLLHYDMYTGETPVQWRNYTIIEGYSEPLWFQNLPAQLTYQDTIATPFPNSGLVTILTEFRTNQGMVCTDAKSIITLSAQKYITSEEAVAER